MPGRIRTTKKLAQRIDRGYFKRLFPISRWRRVLSLAAVGCGLAWLGIHAVAHDQTLYASGPLTAPHAVLSGNCASCHGKTAATGRTIADGTCLSCHDGPVHSAAQTFTPACVDCHVEHRGAEHLVGSSGRVCTGCHSDLKVKAGKPVVAANIESFTHGHPEFAALRNGSPDPGAIKFNHKVHVKGDVPLKCGECHRPEGIDDAWNFGQAPPVPAPAAPVTMPSGRVAPHALMQPVNYYQQCSVCHALTFDDRIPDAAPHVKPEVVHEFVSRKLTEYIAGHPADLGKAGAPGNAAEWVRFRASEDEKQLWTTTCQRCHDMQSAAGGGLPRVPETKIVRRWFTRAEFNHSAHQELQCVSCHPNAATSVKSSDVLLPGLSLCAQCHGAGVGTASADCSTCHLYHDWNKARPVDGRFGIHDLTAGDETARGSSASASHK
jgi:hypothetical protein